MWTRTARDLGAVIEDARKGRRWTQSQLAEAVGTSRHSILRLEAGRPVGVEIALRALRALALELEIRPAEGPGIRSATDVDVNEIVARARSRSDA